VKVVLIAFEAVIAAEAWPFLPLSAGGERRRLIDWLLIGDGQHQDIMIRFRYGEPRLLKKSDGYFSFGSHT